MTREIGGSPTQKRMVGWYNPFQLARTAVSVVTSTVVGRYADSRLVEALNIAQEPYDHSTFWRDLPDGLEEPDPSRPRTEIWIDYVSDCGDGWNSTHAVAHQLARAQLEIPDSAGATHTLPRADLVIFGGDEVYPVASRKNYRERFVRPYEAALRWTEEPHPHAFFVPGNHDWYDGLVAFRRFFCAGRWFGGWRTQQRRSYFAIRLPQHWWLLGTDVQLGSDLDEPQVAFFRAVAKSFGPGDQVILCNAQPFWVYAGLYRHDDPGLYDEGHLDFFERQVLGRAGIVRLFLSGDLHHYRRHATKDGTQKITAGGGGAFLSPTHKPAVDKLVETLPSGDPGRTFTLETSWPGKRSSARLCWKNLAFFLTNPWFAIVPAVLYLLIAFALLPAHTGVPTMASVLRAAFAGPKQLALFLLIGGLFTLFTDTHRTWFRLLAGFTHGFAHTLAALGLAGLALRFFQASPAQSWFLAGFVAVGGGLIGSTLFGLYLLVSLNLFGRHANEAFSALRIQDWKHWLRLHIDRSGNLTVYPVGLRIVPRQWRPLRNGTTSPSFEPADPRATPPELIEDLPITIHART